MGRNSAANQSPRCPEHLNGLRELLTTVARSNRYYSRKFKLAGVDSTVESLADFSNRFPFTTKQELVEDQRNSPPFGTNLTYPIERYNRCHQTSGTTGSPLRWLDTPESWKWMVQNWREVFQAAGVSDTDRVFFPFSFGPFIGFWLAFEAAAEMGCLCLPGGGLSTTARLRTIIDHGVTVLCCTPTYAMRLAEVAAGEGIELKKSSLRTMIVAGEPGGSIPSVRSMIEARWQGVRVFDHHGMTEVGPVTYECPACPGTLHVIESGFVAEIVEPGSRTPAPGGNTGELVLTPLGRTGSPLIRYRTGDLVRARVSGGKSSESVQPCLCGRFELALEGGILGRVDNMIIVRGVNIFPSAVEEVIRSFRQIGEFQVQIRTGRTLSELRILVEPASDGVDVDTAARRLEKRLSELYSLRIPVSSVSKGVLPRFELKANRWVRMQG